MSYWPYTLRKCFHKSDICECGSVSYALVSKDGETNYYIEGYWYGHDPEEVKEGAVKIARNCGIILSTTAITYGGN